jgi:glycerol-3-phosphate acyltransferase PlsY
MILLTVIFTNYLIGSFVAAIFLKQKLNLVNVTKLGSKNPGATNVFRTNGLKKAFLVFAFDFLKAVLPLLFIKVFIGNGFYLQVASLSLVLGHIYPILYDFKGGKGFATYLGCLFVLDYYAFIFSALLWISISKTTKKAALATFSCLLVNLIYTYFFQIKYFEVQIVLTILLIISHFDNLRRFFIKKEINL